MSFTHFSKGALVLAATGWLSAQTTVNLASQSKNVDFSAAPFTRPVKTGTTVPATCTLGDLFFKTNAPAGGNIYACTASNTWSLEAGSAAAGRVAYTDFQISTTLPSAQIQVQPGTITFGNHPCTNFTAPATAQITSSGGGSGVAELYVSDSCALVLEYPSSLVLGFNVSGMAVQPIGIPSVPATASWVGELSISGGAFIAYTDERSTIERTSLMAGNGMISDCAQGPCLLSIDPASVPELGAYNAYTGTEDMRNAVKTFPAKIATADPPICITGEQYFNSTSGVRKDCISTNAWSSAGSITDNAWLPLAGATANGGTIGAGVGLANSNSAQLTSLVGAGYSYGAVQTAHGTALQYVYVTYRLHDTWTGLVTFELDGIGGSAASGTAFFTIDYECGNSADLISAPAYTAASSATVSFDGTGKRRSGVASSALAGCSPGDLLTLRINRAGTNAGDTFTGNVYVLGLAVKAEHR